MVYHYYKNGYYKRKANIAVLYTNVFEYQDITESINHMVKAKTAEEKENGKTFPGMRNEAYTSYKYEITLIQTY